jgi:hypothetical protein
VIAALYRSYLTNVLQHSSVKAVLTWGLTDADSWLNSPRREHKPERPLRPLPFDADLKPKPAFYAEVDAISARRGTVNRSHHLAATHRVLYRTSATLPLSRVTSPSRAGITATGKAEIFCFCNSA